MIEVIVILCAVIIVLVLWISKRPANFPPGPKPLPLVGNIHQLPSGLFYPVVEKWSKQYGPIIGFSAFNQLMIMVDGVDDIIAALRKDEFQSRPDIFGIKARSFGKFLGLFFGVGDQWHSSRKFTVKHMRAYNKHEKENLMSSEINMLVESIKDTKTTKGNGMFGVPAVNVIWSIIANKKIDFQDEESRKFLKNLDLSIRIGNPSGGDPVNFIPILRFVDSNFKFSMKVIDEIHEYIRKTIREHKEVLDANNPVDLIDNYLLEMEKTKNDVSSLFTEEDLIQMGTDLFTAGAESTSNAIDFVLLYMTLYPEIQQKMQEELDCILARARKPELDDKAEMHYTMAVIHEVERMNSVVPTNVPHVCIKDTTFGGYFIPKGTMITMNLRSLGYDPKYWKNPDEFNPDRFLTDDGKFSKPSHLVTFGLGNRACIGEVLARNIIFLFTTTFFEKFSISLPPGEPRPSTTPLAGFTTAPQPFKISIKSRY